MKKPSRKSDSNYNDSHDLSALNKEFALFHSSDNAKLNVIQCNWLAIQKNP
jgi:hypothetical protein